LNKSFQFDQVKIINKTSYQIKFPTMQSSTSGSGGGVQQQLRGGTLAKQRAETALREANVRSNFRTFH
jgi:hypothetical protein